MLATDNGAYAAAVQHARQALAVFGPLGLTARMALAATVLGSAQRSLGDRAGARHGFETALDLRAELGDRHGMSVAMNNMALLELDDGDLDRAREQFEQSLAIKRELGEQRSNSIGLVNLADVLIRTEQWDAADEALAEAVGLTGGDPQLAGTIKTQPGHSGRPPPRLRRGGRALPRRDRRRGGRGSSARRCRGGDRPRPVYQQTGEHDEAVRQPRAAEELAARPGIRSSSPRRRSALAGITNAPSAAPGGRDLAAPVPGNLIARQAEVLRLLAAGLTNRQIAAALFLSTATVERHLATIYLNLGMSGRVEAARFALANGLAAEPARRVT
ncbi:MAG: response regulator transcription factor [Streptosporangiaceae bacterium]